jgi:glycosyltransferase involved in cell wall biosynthesis
LRFAFENFGNQHWGGGNIALDNFLRGLRALGADRPDLALIADRDQSPDEYAGLAPLVDEVLRAPLRSVSHETHVGISLRSHFASWVRARLPLAAAQSKLQPLSEFFLKHRVDALLLMPWTETAITTVPTVVWIPDFQHVYLPELYTPHDRAGRDRIFRAQIRAAARVLVTAEAVRQDLEAFAPEQAAKVRCVGFVAHVPEDAYRDDPREGLARYHLPDRFIYLPNQFWQHKNHSLVFEALARLAARGVQPCLVSTGNPLDYRRPAYFSELMQQLSQANLRQQFIILGHVPRADVFRLMRQAVCVLNPSRFEGFGMSVGESKSLGKRVLASDLGPLREQAAPGAVYFDPADADDLAAKLETAWLTWPAGPDQAMETAARAELPRRQAAFGRELFGVFEESKAAFEHPDGRLASPVLNLGQT